MGFRFRKSKKLGPVRLNLSKSGLGASVGVKGFRVTKTAAGRTRTTASIPGTGISYVTETSSKRAAKSQRKGSARGKIGCLPVFAVFLLLVVFGSIGGASSKRKAEPKPTVEVVAPASENLVAAVAITSKPESTPEPTPTPTPAPTPVPTPTPAPITASKSALEPVVSTTVASFAAKPTAEPANAVGYVANTNTGRFHKPSCSSVDEIAEKNKVCYDVTRSEMIAMGYVPCKRCNP